MTYVLVCCSAGGHLETGRALVRALDVEPVRWATFDTPDALAKVGPPFIVMRAPTNRHLVNLIRNVGRIVAATWKERPVAVLSTGAGPGLAGAVSARVLRIPCVHIDPVDHVARLTLSAKAIAAIGVPVVSRAADARVPVPARRYVRQAPPVFELVAGDVPTHVCGPECFLEGGLTAYRTIVLGGTHESGFPRLRELVLATDAAPVLVQGCDAGLLAEGSVSVRMTAPGLHEVGYLTSEQIEHFVDRADVVYIHGASGLLLDALERGHQPIMVPRLPEFGEHVDDHQVDFTNWSLRNDLAVSEHHGRSTRRGRGYRRRVNREVLELVRSLLT